MTAHDQTGFTEVHPDPLRELRHITKLRATLVRLETLALKGPINREGPSWAAMLHAAYDLTEIDAVYEAADEITPDEDAQDLFGNPLGSWAARVASVQFDEGKAL